MNSFCITQDGFYDSSAVLMDASSSIDSDASPYADRSFSLASGDHQEQSSQYSTEVQHLWFLKIYHCNCNNKFALYMRTLRMAHKEHYVCIYV